MSPIYIGFIIAFVIVILVSLLKSAGSNGTKYLINSLQPIKGKHYNQIVEKIQNPTTVTNYDDGDFDCEWITSSYQVTLRFNSDNICLGIIKESYQNVN